MCKPSKGRFFLTDETLDFLTSFQFQSKASKTLIKRQFIRNTNIKTYSMLVFLPADPGVPKEVKSL